MTYLKKFPMMLTDNDDDAFVNEFVDELVDDMYDDDDVISTIG